jgi:hypothetical protein
VVGSRLQNNTAERGGAVQFLQRAQDCTGTRLLVSDFFVSCCMACNPT